MENLLHLWNFNLPLLAALAAGIIMFLFVNKFAININLLFFFTAILLISICLVSPLYLAGENYFFSAHMISHVVLLLLAAPLLMLSIPIKSVIGKYLFLFSKKSYSFPFASWIAGVGIMWLWHIPIIFHAMMNMDMNSSMQQNILMNVLMIIHPVSLVLAGMLFCLPVLTPFKEFRLKAPTAVLYLASACVCCSLLGLLITFAPVNTYTFYIMNDGSGMLSLIRNNWGISAAEDQQIAGLIMWVPCCFIYLSASMIIMIKWFGEDALEKNIILPRRLVIKNS